jgi:uncharacterized protein
MHLNFPFTIKHGAIGRPDSRRAYIEQLIEQVLFTVPGERVNRPDFGCGIQYVVFQPGNSEVVTATLFIVRSELQRQLDGIVQIEDVAAEMDGSELHVSVRYIDPANQQRWHVRFRR